MKTRFSESIVYALHAVTIFLSAFLLFSIQPIVGKHLLPYFGGSSSVWATSLLFFTTILFLGYAYVYVITRASRQTQVIMHSTLVGLVSFSALFLFLTTGTIYPQIEWLVGSTYTPAWSVLLALNLMVGAPCFLLSTTGPLLQYWYGTGTTLEPYKLYALSNAGSLIALMSYPFIIEPRISLPTQEGAWALLFIVFVCLTIPIVFFARKSPQAALSQAAATPRAQTSSYAWILYGALPSFMLVATTTVITQLISPIPLLWIAPLALYLVTFIVAFRGWGQSIYMPFFVLIAAIVAFIYTPGAPFQIVPQVASYLLLLFLASLYCHARLFALRPPTENLPLFYIATSCGGMIGAFAASLVAPIIFSDFWEFACGIALCAGLAWYRLPIEVFPRAMRDSTILITKIVFPFILLTILTSLITDTVSDSAISSRNFYGAVKVKFTDNSTSLQHGTTLHGMQASAPMWRYAPSTYYTPTSGVGRAISYIEQGLMDSSMNVGVIGLGTGSLAAYCKGNDTYVYYEIDPRIETIARTYFSYLEHCRNSSVRIGDGRLLLDSEKNSGTLGAYDVLAVDAFTDDAIPVHLLTQEAVALYMAHLKNDKSILAIHTSNRFLSLAPVLLRITQTLGLSAMVVTDNDPEADLSTSSQWVLLTRDPRVFDSPAFYGVEPWTPPRETAALWTDTYTSLFAVLNLPKPW